MQKLLMTLVISMIDICLMAQANIDFSPKMLQNDLTKAYGKPVDLKEHALTPAIAREVYLGKFFTVTQKSPETKYKHLYIGRVKTCRAGGCSIKHDPKSTDSEYFDYYILFDSTLTVQLVKIYNYQATHGQEVTARSWLKQFKGYSGDKELVAKKNVDAISGATISVDAISFDIFHKTGLMKEVVEQ